MLLLFNDAKYKPRQQRENCPLLRHPAHKLVHAPLQYQTCRPVAVSVVMMSKIGHWPSWRTNVYPELYSVAMMNCCVAVCYTNKVKKGDGKSLFHLLAVITHLGQKDCKVKQEMAGCMASKDCKKDLNPELCNQSCVLSFLRHSETSQVACYYTSALGAVAELGVQCEHQ